jgi:hypothetical protein
MKGCTRYLGWDPLLVNHFTCRGPNDFYDIETLRIQLHVLEGKGEKAKPQLIPLEGLRRGFAWRSEA